MTKKLSNCAALSVGVDRGEELCACDWSMWPIPHPAPGNPINAAALSTIYVKEGVQRPRKIPIVKIPF